MRTIISGFIAFLLLAGAVSSAEAGPAAAAPDPAAVIQKEDPAQLRQEIDQLKKALGVLEQRLAVQEKAVQSSSKTEENTVAVDELEKRVAESEKERALDRLKFSGDYRFEAHSIWGRVPAHIDGMGMQNLMVKTVWFAGLNGYTPAQMAGLLNSPTLPNGQPNTPANFATMINGAVATNYASYQYFTNNLNYSQLNGAAQAFK